MGGGVINSDLGDAYDNAMVQSLMIPGLEQWDRDLIVHLFSPTDMEVILNILLS